MRKVKDKEQRQRGCVYCYYSKVTTKIKCPFNKCPFRELDDIKNYEKETEKGGKFEIITFETLF